MSTRRNHVLLLWVAATDSSFDLQPVRGRPMLVGRCIHCRSRHSIQPDGTPVSDATLEHILPQCHGGTDALENLAVACARCNSDKGVRHDRRSRQDPKLLSLVEDLRARRAARMRAPLPGLSLPAYPKV